MCSSPKASFFPGAAQTLLGAIWIAAASPHALQLAAVARAWLGLLSVATLPTQERKKHTNVNNFFRLAIFGVRLEYRIRRRSLACELPVFSLLGPLGRPRFGAGARASRALRGAETKMQIRVL